MERVTTCHFHVNCQYGVVARSGTSNEALTGQPLVLIFSRGFPKSTHPYPLELGRVSIRTIDDPSRHLQRNSVVARLYLVLCNSLARRIAGPRVSQLPAFIPTIWGCLLLLAPSQALCCNSCRCTEYFAVFLAKSQIGIPAHPDWSLERLGLGRPYSLPPGYLHTTFFRVLHN